MITYDIQENQLVRLFHGRPESAWDIDQLLARYKVKEFEYYLNEALDDYVDMSVYYDEGGASWCMDMTRDLQTLTINEPSYCYSPDENSTYDGVDWVNIPKHIQEYFDKYRDRAKTILILGDSK